MRNLGMRPPGSRGFTLALFGLCTGILLTTSACAVQQPPRIDRNKPWADLTWQERYYLEKAEYQQIGTDRRTGCPKKRCG